MIINLQRKIRLDLKPFKQFYELVTGAVAETNGRSASIAFVSDRRMKQLNSFFRSKNSTTDVLSFPHEPDEFDPDTSNLGDIVISAEQAAGQAKENGLTLESEI